MKRAVEEILKFNEERDWDQFHNPENLAKSISIEAGELLECFQWNNEYDKQHVCEELADVMNYCILMANKLGVDMEEILLIINDNLNMYINDHLRMYTSDYALI